MVDAGKSKKHRKNPLSPSCRGSFRPQVRPSRWKRKLQRVKANGGALDDKIVMVLGLVGLSCTVRMGADVITGQGWSALVMGVWAVLFSVCCGYSIYTERLHVVQTEILCIVAAVLVTWQDLLTYGELDMWLWLIVIIDVSFLTGSRLSVRVFVAGFSCIYICLKTIQEATDIGLFYFADNIQYTDINRPESRGSDWAANAIVIRMSIFVFNCVLVYGIGETALSLHNLMSEVCADLSHFDLDSAEMHILNFSERTTGVAHLARLTENLRRYQLFIPDDPSDSNQTQTQPLALLQITIPSPTGDLTPILAKARSWGGAVATCDPTAALVAFNPGGHQGVLGYWGANKLIISIESPQGGAKILRCMNANFRKEPARLVERGFPVPPPFFADPPPMYFAYMGEGKAWLRVGLGGVLQACFEGVKGQSEGEVVCLRRAAGGVGLASGCALAIRDSFQDVDLKMAVVWEECDISIGGNVTGRGVVLTQEVMDIAKELDSTLVCSHSAEEHIHGLYTVKEVHAGPVDDGPIFEFCDADEISKLQRLERTLLESLPTNRVIPLSDLADSSQWAVVGKGKTGRVMLVPYLKTSQSIAVKELRTDSTMEVGVKDRISFLRELIHMNDLRFNTIVNFYGYAKGTDAQIFLLMEYCKGTLQDVVYDRYLSDDSRATIAISMGAAISQALSYIHSRDKVHMDIASRNVLVTEEGGYKLSDFGLMHQVGEHAEVIAYPWAPPEGISTARTAQFAYDVWSFGMLMYEVLSGSPPYGLPFSLVRVKEMVTSGVLPDTPQSVARSERCAAIWDTVVLPCLVSTPLARPTMSQLASLLTDLQPHSSESFPRQQSSTIVTTTSQYAYLETTYTSDNLYGTIPPDYHPMPEESPVK